MIKVSVMYPYTPGARFDHAYYRDVHMPLVETLLKDRCIAYAVDKGVASGQPERPPVYVAMCHILSSSADAFQAGMKEHGETIFADIANFTDIAPVVQTSEVVVERSQA